MDFSYLSNLSHDRQTKDSGKRHQVLPASKHIPSSKVAASAVQQFLARKQEEERQKYEELRRRKEQLLSLRSQNSKNNKKAKLMASRTRDNDFSKIKLTEEEEEAKVNREKELKRKGLSNKVDRMKARIELEERDSQLPRKRKRKSHLSNSGEPQGDISATNTFVKVEQKVNNSGICQKNEVDKKILNKPKPSRLIDYKDLLQVAAKKQFEPIPIQDEDFEEDSDEYEEEDEVHSVSAEKSPRKNLQQYNSLKEDRALERQHGTSDKRVQEERLDVGKSKQNKENTYRNHDHNSNNRPHKPSGEHDKKAYGNRQHNTSLLQSMSLRNSPGSSALHGKENQTSYGRETHASKNIHSHRYKHHYDKDSNADRNMGISRHNDISKPSNLIKEERKTSDVPSEGRTKYQNSFFRSQSPRAEDSHSDLLAQKRKHQETFRNSIKGLPDRRNSECCTEYNKNDQKVPTSVHKQYLKKDGETRSEPGNTHSDSVGYKKVESHPFRIPKRSSNKAKSPQDDRPSYYTDGTSNSFEDVKRSSANKIANVKSPGNHVSKSGKNCLKEKLEKKSLHYDKTNKSHTKFNHLNEEGTKSKHVNEMPNHATSQNSDSRGKEKSCSHAPEKTLLNRSDKIYNSDEYFTQEGQKNYCHKSSVEKISSKSRLKERSEAASSNSMSQYYTEEFTIGKSKGKTVDSKHHSSKNLNYDKCKTKDSHSSMKAHGNSSQTADCTKSHKYEKIKAQESQYFTEDFVENQKNATHVNSKHDKKTKALQAERQSSHFQYFTENFATDRQNIEKSSKRSNYKYDKRISSQQEEMGEKQSQYFTESFEKNVVRKNDKRSSASQKESQYFTEDFIRAESSRTKSNEHGCKYDRRTSSPPKERNEPQYFTEHYTNKKSEAKGSNTNCKYDKRTVPHAKENEMKESHYFTEKFSTSETKVSNNNFTFDSNKRTSLLQKEKQRDHSQYSTGKSYRDESDNMKRSDNNGKNGKRFTGSNKEKQTKPVQYFTESFTSDGHHLTKTGRNQSHQHARNGTTSHVEKGKNNRSQSSSKVEEYVPTKITKTVEEYTPGEISCEVEEYIPTKIKNKVEEYIPQKIVNKENLPKRPSGTSYHSSDSHSERHIKTSGYGHSYKSDEVRIPKRPRENSEDEMYPSKVCRYENSGNSKADASNFKKDKSLAKHSFEKSKSTLNHSKTYSEKKKQLIEANKSKEKINDRTNNSVQCSKMVINEHKVNQKEKMISNSHLNNKLNGSHERIHKLELSSHKKPSGKLPSEKQDNVKKVPAPSNNSLLKNTMPPIDRKIIPASSMAQMMNRKLSQGRPSVETASANNQNSEARKTNEKKSLVDAKRTVQQTKSDVAPFSRAKADTGKSIPPKQLHRDSKSDASNQQKVNSSSQRTERKDIEHSKKPIVGSHRKLEERPMLNQDRRVKREEYEGKIRNRYSRPSPRMFIKRNLESDDDEEEEDEEDDDMSDFIDDGPIDEDEEDYSHYIREIFGYDKRRYRNEDDFDDREMETSYAQQMKEERRSARIGYLEDLEDMRKEEEEKMRKAKVKKGKHARIGYLEDLEDMRKEEEEKMRKAKVKKGKQ